MRTSPQTARQKACCSKAIVAPLAGGRRRRACLAVLVRGCARAALAVVGLPLFSAFWGCLLCLLAAFWRCLAVLFGRCVLRSFLLFWRGLLVCLLFCLRVGLLFGVGVAFSRVLGVLPLRWVGLLFCPAFRFSFVFAVCSLSSLPFVLPSRVCFSPVGLPFRPSAVSPLAFLGAFPSFVALLVGFSSLAVEGVLLFAAFLGAKTARRTNPARKPN